MSEGKKSRILRALRYSARIAWAPMLRVCMISKAVLFFVWMHLRGAGKALSDPEHGWKRWATLIGSFLAAFTFWATWRMDIREVRYSQISRQYSELMLALERFDGRTSELDGLEEEHYRELSSILAALPNLRAFRCVDEFSFLQPSTWFDEGRAPYAHVANTVYERYAPILRHLNLAGADFTGANLEGIDLQGANLAQGNLQRANLDAANLHGAYLVKANLEGTYLVKANLERAYLTEANVRGANLGGANLQGAHLNSIRNWKHITNLARANLRSLGARPPGFLAWAKEHGAIVDEEQLAEDSKHE